MALLSRQQQIRETTFVKGKVCMFTKISQMPKGSRLFFNSYGATWIVFANKA
jgi:hypothetical protein